MREPPSPPADYVAFVNRCAGRLHAAARELTGDDEAAAALASALLAATARRWSVLRPRAGDPASRLAAPAYVAALFRREAAARGHHGRPPAAREREGTRQNADMAVLRDRATQRDGVPPRDRVQALLAGSAWAQRRPARRHQLLAAAGVSCAVLVAMLVRPAVPPPEDLSVEPPSSVTTSAPAHLPPGVDVLPDARGQRTLPWLDTALPAHISLNQPVGPLPAHPTRRALAVFRLRGAPLLVLGEDGKVRTVPEELVPLPAPRAQYSESRLTVTALSPDGTRLALAISGMVTVLDVPTATVRRYPLTERVRWVVWVGARTLLVGGLTSSSLLDVGSGRSVDSAVQARTALSPRGDGVAYQAPVPHRRPDAPPTASPRPTGPAGPGTGTVRPARDNIPAEPAPGLSFAVPGAVELLAVGEPVTAPARVRRHTPFRDAVLPLDTALSGELAPWVGPWRGSGFLTRHWAFRDCTTSGTLPVRYGAAMVATAAVNPASGRVHRILVSTMSDSLELPQAVGGLGPGGVLVRAPGEGDTANLVAWLADVGELYMVATLDRDPGTTLADLSVVR